MPTYDAEAMIASQISEHMAVISGLLADPTPIHRLADLLSTSMAQGHKVFFFGNGGSAADAQHIAAEFVGRFERERRALPALSLSTDTSALTALANDYSYQVVFSRQLEALAQPGDVAVGISTSGRSANVLTALQTARHRGCRTVLVTGAEHSAPDGLLDLALTVPSRRTARIQEAHIVVWHIVASLVEEALLTDSTDQHPESEHA